MSKQAIRHYFRDGLQQCPICQTQTRLVEHHIHGRKVHRWNESWNIVWLCPNCHDAVHSNDIIINDWVKTSSGRELMWEIVSQSVTN